MPTTPLSSVPPRKLSIRRGSTSAFDPHAKYAETNCNPDRSTSSTLTIVKVANAPQPQTNAAILSQESSHGRRFRRRLSTGSSGGDVQPRGGSPSRLSFALSSFTSSPSSGGSGPPNTSPSSSPRLRPSSPTSAAHLQRSGSLKPRLNAEQIYDLAKQCTNPNSFPISTPSHETAPRPHSPASHSRSPSQSSNLAISAAAPATFTPLTDDICLPFIDRPSEVATLISTPPSARLFALLEQTFPKRPITSSIVYDSTVSLASSLISDPGTLPKDPTTWTYSELQTWLTGATRAAAPDPLWVQKVRKCILFHSELIWERVKGALGVPPELDIDGDTDAFEIFYADRGKDTDDVDTDDMEDAGRKARGYWEDWDAVMDSPIFERRSSFRSSHSGSPRVSLSRNHSLTELDKFRAMVAMSSSTGPTVPKMTKEVTLTTLLPMSLSVDTDTDAYSQTLSRPGSPFGLFIEPLISTISSSLPNVVATDNNGLGDIAEVEEEVSDAGTSLDAKASPGKEREFMEPSSVMGIKISTVTETPGSPVSTRTQVSSVAASPVQSYFPNFSNHNFHRSISSSSLNEIRQRRGSSASLLGYRHVTETAKSGGSRVFHLSNDWLYDNEGDGYDPVGDRAPGNPLFPSNFARLALGPTLVANNPALHSPVNPPVPRYALHPSYYRARRSNSTSSSLSNTSSYPPGHKVAEDVTRSVGQPKAVTGRGSRHEYTATVASDSSAGGE